MAKNEAVETEVQDSGDAPLIDLNDASIKKMIARAKKRGFITIDELNEALPQDQMSSEQIEDVMSAINDMWRGHASRRCAPRRRSSTTISTTTGPGPGCFSTYSSAPSSGCTTASCGLCPSG